ncbi:hypothetical protein CC2G_013104 [Coprinopsis cinerea AmutBmut pab1-1]|nr:hypothetical protein CC2G_013104 [Coprinopsis cinerea AmutBmut pab1-1]
MYLSLCEHIPDRHETLDEGKVTPYLRFGSAGQLSARDPTGEAGQDEQVDLLGCRVEERIVNRPNYKRLPTSILCCQ